MTAEEKTGAATAATDVVETEIADFVAERTRIRPEPDQDLFATGLATSMFAMQLVMFLEETYSVSVAGPDLQLVNFRTARSMAALVARLRAEAAGGDV